MYFDFEDRYVDYQPVGGGIRRWDGVLISIGMHIVAVLLALLVPTLPLFAPDPDVEAATAVPEPERDRPTFVFV